MEYNHETALEEAKKELIANGEVKENNPLVISVKLNDGKVIKLDFGKFTGETIIDIKKRYAKLRKKESSLIEEFDDFYYILVAEKASGFGYETLLKLPYKDFARVRNAARDFLGDD